MTIVYLDEAAALNALCDYLLLRSAAELRGLPRRRGRCAFAAALGGVWAALSLLPSFGFLALPSAALAASGFLALIAFGADEGLWRSWVSFLALSAAFAGAAVFAALLLGEETGGDTVPRCTLRLLLLSFSLFYALLRLCLSRVLEKRRRERVRVVVTLLGRRAELTALRDTGNTLTDPVSGCRVLIANRAALAPLFPFPLPEGGAVELFRALGEQGEYGLRSRLVPFRSVGGEGLLLCFRPDAVTVDGEERRLLIGVSPLPVGERGEYRAIV